MARPKKQTFHDEPDAVLLAEREQVAEMANADDLTQDEVRDALKPFLAQGATLTFSADHKHWTLAAKFTIRPRKGPSKEGHLSVGGNCHMRQIDVENSGSWLWGRISEVKSSYALDQVGDIKV